MVAVPFSGIGRQLLGGKLPGGIPDQHLIFTQNHFPTPVISSAAISSPDIIVL